MGRRRSDLTSPPRRPALEGQTAVPRALCAGDALVADQDETSTGERDEQTPDPGVAAVRGREYLKSGVPSTPHEMIDIAPSCSCA